MKSYHKTIIFTKTPLKSYYIFEDYFQLFPCNIENFPISKYQTHYPAILEFWTDESESISLETEFGIEVEFLNEAATMHAKQQEILTLLSAFSNNLFFTYDFHQQMWGIPFLGDIPDNEQSSVWCIPLYKWSEMNGKLKIEHFSSLNFNKIKYDSHERYFFTNPNLDFDQNLEIVFTDKIDKLLRAFYSLPVDLKTIIYTACIYCVNAMELRKKHHTLSLLAAFTSIETMVNLEYRNFNVIPCPTCSTPQYKVSKKFREFLLKFIGNSIENKKKFNNLYNLRSKIIHTGQRLNIDTLFSKLSKEGKEEELFSSIEVLQISKLAIMNWLLFQATEEPK